MYCCPTKELSCLAESKYDILPEYLIHRAAMELSVEQQPLVGIKAGFCVATIVCLFDTDHG